MFKSSFFYILAIAFQAGSSLLFLPAQRQILGLSEAGTIIWIVSLTALIAGFSNLGVSEAILYAVKQEGISKSSIRRLTLFAIIPSSIITFIILVVTIVLWNVSGQAVFYCVFVATLSIPAISLISLNISALRSLGKSGSFATQTAMWMLGAPLIATISLFVLQSPNIEGYLFVWVVGIWLAAIFGFVIVQNVQPKDVLEDENNRVGKMFFRLSKSGFPLMLHGSTGTIVANLDRIFLAGFVGASEVAIFQVVYLLGLAPTVVLGALNGAWALHFFESHRELDRWQAIKHESKFITAIALLIAGGIFMTGVPVMNLMLSPEVVKGIPSTFLVALGFVGLFQIPYFMASNALYQGGYNKAIAMITIPNLIIQSIVSIMLIKIIGLAGPIIAITSFQIFQSFRIWKTSTKHSEILPLPATWFVAVLIALALIATSVLLPIVPLYVFGIVSILVSAVIFLLTKLANNPATDGP